MHKSLSEHSQPHSLELVEVLSQLWTERWWILVSTVVVASIFVVAAFRMTPVYRASTVLVAAGQERAGLGGALSSALGSLAGLASLAGVSVGSSASGTDEALGVLRSRQFAERFIVERKLLPVLFGNMWDEADGRWKVPLEKQPSLGQAVKYFFHDILTITQDKKTGLFTLQIEWTDRLAAAVWANDLVQRLNAEMRSRAIENADASLGFLRKELDGTSIVETREAINRLIEAQINNRMILSVTNEYSFRVVDRAYPSEPGDMVRPKKRLMIAFGLFVGMTFGSVAVIFSRLLRYPISRTA